MFIFLVVLKGDGIVEGFILVCKDSLFFLAGKDS